MEVFEFEGKTTEDAIENASRQLNLPVEDLDIDIIEPYVVVGLGGDDLEVFLLLKKYLLLMGSHLGFP